MFKKKDKASMSHFTYRGVVGISKVVSPILKGLYYACILAVLLAGIIALIMLLVNVSVDEMMLPPYMSETEGGYSITIGNGIRIDASRDNVTLSDIKTVVYAELLLAAATLCILAPISLFLSKLAKNLAMGELYHMKNGRYMMYVGLTVAIGYSFIGIARDFYNYLLVKTFVPDPTLIHLSMRPDLGGVLVGLLIIIFAYIYAHTCEKQMLEEALPDKESTDVTKA